MNRRPTELGNARAPEKPVSGQNLGASAWRLAGSDKSGVQFLIFWSCAPDLVRRVYNGLNRGKNPQKRLGKGAPCILRDIWKLP
ncbi:Uncharacterised protein [Mobiluncus mulieris]|nr:Uncharacterised protein [Mobiluncus mulieris]